MLQLKPTIYLIRHGEKAPKLPNGEDTIGLNAQGLKRANALVETFKSDSQYRIGHIIAQRPKESKNCIPSRLKNKHWITGTDGRQKRPYDTVAPLAKALGLNVDTTFDRNDIKAVAKAAQDFAGDGNVLICWEHRRLAKIAEALGVKSYGKNSGWTGIITYAKDRFDLIWTIEPPYEEIVSVTSEAVAGLDQTVAGQNTLQVNW
jgi:hypothetical protein